MNATSFTSTSSYLNSNYKVNFSVIISCCNMSIFHAHWNESINTKVVCRKTVFLPSSISSTTTKENQVTSLVCVLPSFSRSTRGICMYVQLVRLNFFSYNNLWCSFSQSIYIDRIHFLNNDITFHCINKS